MTRRPIFAAALALAPISASADLHDGPGPALLVQDPAMCAALTDLPAEEHLSQIIHNDGMALMSDGIWAIEYNCQFDREIEFVWSDGPRQIRPGYCEEPGSVYPTVFVIEMWDGEQGLARVWQQGEEEPTEFFACGGR